MLGRISFPTILAFWMGVSALAQSYQTQFGDIKFDRAASPSSWHGGVEVDQASGALSIKLPLGPGIGARGLKFQPILSGNWSPKIDNQTVPLGDNVWSEVSVISNNGGFSFTPGYYNLVFDPEGDVSVTSNDDSSSRVRSPHLTNYLAPDGFSGSLNPEEVEPGFVPTLAQAQALIQAFGFGSGWEIGNAVWQQATGGPSGRYIFRGPGGELVLGLTHPTLAPEQLCVPVIGTALKPGGSSPDTYYHFPGAVLVINGNIGYHYQWRSNRYSALSLTWFAQGWVQTNAGDMSTWVGMRFVRHAAFAMASMRNRNGDRIDFEKAGEGWTATWRTSMGDSGVSIAFDGTNLRYQGVANAPQFHLEGVAPVPPNAGTSLDGFSMTSSQTAPSSDKGYDGFRECAVTAVEDDTSHDRVSLVYHRGAYPADSIMTWCYPQEVAFPGRKITLTWETYEYFRNLPDSLNLTPDHYRWMNPPSYHDGYYFTPLFAKGVSTLTEVDLLGAAPARITHYRRQVPVPDRRNPGYWLSTAFTVQTILPDTSSTITRFVEPPNGPFQSDTASVATNMQVLAFLKHQVTEVRYYGVGINASTDFVPNPVVGAPCLKDLATSPAHRVELFDRWDLHTPTNPQGALTRGAIPFPTRKRVWDALNRTLKTEEQADWDANQFGWKTVWSLSEGLTAPPSPTTDFAGQAMLGGTATYSNVVNGILRKAARTYETQQETWILGRPTYEVTSTESDSTPGRANGAVVPMTLPPTTKVYDATVPMLGRLAEIQVGPPGLQLRTVFGYKGTEGVASAQLESARLLGPNQQLTGPVGADYDYDQAFGLMNQIRPLGVSWTLGQTSDGLGRVVAQEDANHLTNTFSWDGSGRLRAIQPPSPEVSQSLTPDVDSRGMVIEHGTQRTRLRYNAFGQVALEQRSNDGTTWTSHRIHAYDSAGRKTGESVWLSGSGADALANSPNLTLSQAVSYFTPGHWECAQQDEYGNCIKGRIWEPDTYDTTVLPGLMLGSGVQYDIYGREILRQDANGVRTTITYGERTKSITVGEGADAMPTHYVYDSSGRLIKVVDALSQVTTYAYDPADRILEVRQFSGSTGSGPAASGTGQVQIRKWQYDALGRTILLEQPESGVTYFTAFNVLGKPSKTVYGLPAGWRPASPDVEDTSATSVAGVRVVTTSYDALGRTKSVGSNDGSVQQVMTYDEGNRGLSNGKLTTATSGPSVSRQLIYSGLNGRLSSLVRVIDDRSFTQSIHWRNEGLLDSRTYPDGRVQSLQYDLAKEAPNGSSFGSDGPTTFAYDPTHWGLQGITFASNASSFLTYSNDQTRLRALNHTLPSGTLQAWTYTYDSAGRLYSDGDDYYAYDALGRLTQAMVRDPFNANPIQGIRQVFTYDAFGNRTGLDSRTVLNWTAGGAPPSDPQTTTTAKAQIYSFNPSHAALNQHNQLPDSTASGAATGAAYDAQGNLKTIFKAIGDSGRSLNLTYDALGRVRTLTDGSRNLVEVYTYDDEGLRAMVEVYQGPPTPANLQKKHYRIYNESRQLVAEYELVLE